MIIEDSNVGESDDHQKIKGVNSQSNTNPSRVQSHSKLAMDIPWLLPMRMRRRLCGSVISRRLLTMVLLVTATFLLLNQRPVFSSSDDKPQMNDRRILESNSAVVVPQPVDVGLRARGTLDGGASSHPKHLFNNQDGKVEVSVVLVMCASRAAAVKNHVDQLVRYRPSAERFPIVISQDGSDQAVTNVINGFVNDTQRISFIHHSHRKGEHSQAAKSAKNYFFIAQHFKWALDHVFFEMKYDTVIITEDDLDIAEDFFSYFSATRHLLREDPTVWCVSAWNDNGGTNITDRSRSENLYRTDFFPGLGWMLSLEVWKELSPKWPEFYWDDWLRKQEVRKGRVCIRPEVSRTAHNNKVAGRGTSGGMYKLYLASVRLPETPIDFSLLDLSYLSKSNYDRMLQTRLKEAKVISLETAKSLELPSPDNSYLVVYHNAREYRELAKAIGLMVDIRGGMARTAYYGVVSFMVKGCRVYAIRRSLDTGVDFTSDSAKCYNDDWDKMNAFLDFEETFCRPNKFEGVCDPKNPELVKWFEKKHLTRRLKTWGDMIVN